MKNKWIKLSIFLIISLLLFTGCKIQSVDEYNDEKNIESNETKETVSSDSLKHNDGNDKKDDKNKSEDEEKNQDIKKQDEKVTSSSDNKTDSKDNNETKKESSNDSKSEQKTNTNDNSNNDSNDKTNSQSKPKPQPEPEKKPDPKPQPQPQEPSKKYVTIEIRVDTILDNYDKLDPKLKNEKFVPKNGVILSKTKYEITDGETVLNVLAKVTRQNRIPMEYRGSGSSAYIEGINNIYEFSCGDKSGWKYKVNGIYPNHGAGAHKLNNGDSISWNYTCDLGRDL